MSDTFLRKRQPLAPPVPPPLDFDVYNKALYDQPPVPAALPAQTEEQIKHVGWRVIEATNHQSESIGNRLKERVSPILQQAKRLPAAANASFSKFTPFQILGGILLIVAAFLLMVAKSQAGFILTASGAAQLAIDTMLKKKIQ